MRVPRAATTAIAVCSLLSSVNGVWVRAAIPFRLSGSTTSSSSTGQRLLPQPALAGDYVCKSLGACVPCPAAEMGSAVCKVYGHRRPLSCINAVSTGGQQDDEDERSDRRPARSALTATQQGSQQQQSEAGVTDRRIHQQQLDRVDPDPQNLDDEQLKDSLRPVGNSLERRKRKRAWHTALFNRRDAVVDDDNVSGRELYTWEACSRVLPQEREDFFEFVLCNMFFATVSVVVLWYRHRALASRQYGTLAARIGVRETH
ncbi:hypothetical protein ACM66B_000247 [Microbotryomycetes sp. NB124-2]